MNVVEIRKCVVRDFFGLAEVDQVLALFGKQKLRLTRGTQVANPVATVEVVGFLGTDGVFVVDDLGDFNRLVMAERRIVSINYIPAVVLGNLDVIGNDLKRVLDKILTQ